MSTLSARHGWTVRRDDAVNCTCEPRNARHGFGWQCLKMDEVRRWASKTGCSMRVAREMLWLHKTFAPIPEREIPF